MKNGNIIKHIIQQPFNFLYNRFQTCTEVIVMLSHGVKWTLCGVTSVHSDTRSSPCKVRSVPASLPVARTWLWANTVASCEPTRRLRYQALSHKCHRDIRQTGSRVESDIVIMLTSSPVNFCPSGNWIPQCRCSTGQETRIAAWRTYSKDEDKNKRLERVKSSPSII